MNLHLLRTFAAVAAHQSFSRAAEAIHVSQPAVSKAVRELEGQLGLALLERQGGQFQLTEAGAALWKHARAIFALERAAEADMRGRRGLEHGSLAIGASKTIAAYLLPPLITRFLQQYPGIDVRIISDNTEAIEKRLLAYELDLAFVEGPIHDPRVELTAWREDELVILAPAQHPLADGREVAPAALAGERWIVREEGSGTRAVAQRLLQEIGVEVRQMIEVGSNGAVVQSVAAGLGLAMISVEVARDQLALGRVKVVELAGKRFRRPMNRVRLRDKPTSPAAEAFETTLEENLAESAAL